MSDIDLEDLTDEEREAPRRHRRVHRHRRRHGWRNSSSKSASSPDLSTRPRLIRMSPSYSKWDRLRETLDDNEHMRDDSGVRRKVIIFTEHKDTLDDLTDRLRAPPRT